MHKQVGGAGILYEILLEPFLKRHSTSPAMVSADTPEEHNKRWAALPLQHRESMVVPALIAGLCLIDKGK